MAGRLSGMAGRPGRQAGTVTAELALAMPGVVLLAGFVLAAGTAAVQQVRCVDAARAGARAAARHDPTASVAATVTALAPAGARVSVSTVGDDVVVDVRAAARLPLPGSPGLPVGARAAVAVEPVP